MRTYSRAQAANIVGWDGKRNLRCRRLHVDFVLDENRAF